MKKRFLVGRGLLAAAVMASAGGVLAFWALPAEAAGTPQISVKAVYNGSGGAAPTPGHPKVASTALLSAGYVAYSPNGDEAVAVNLGTGASYAYLIAGSTEANEYHLWTSGAVTTKVYGSLIAGDAYALAGGGPAGIVTNPGYSTHTTGGSTSAIAVTNPVAATSLVFDANGNLLIAGSHTSTAVNHSGIQMVAKANCSSACAYRISALTAGDLYTLFGVGLRGLSHTAAVTFTSGVAGTGVSVDAQGNIVDGGIGNVVFINEGTSTVNRYGKSIPTSARVAQVAGTPTTGRTNVCTAGGVKVPATGATGPFLLAPHPYFDIHGNIYLNDDSTTVHGGCTWVLPAAAGTATLDGHTVHGGTVTSLTGPATNAAVTGTGGVTAATHSFPNTSGVILDPAGNVILTSAGTTPTLRVIAEHTATYYNVAMTAGKVYVISGNGSRTTTPGNATGFQFSGHAVSGTPPYYGLTSITNGASGDLLMTDGASGTLGTLYLVTGAPLPVLATVTSISPTSGTTAGGTVVTIHGHHLTAATAVHFGASLGTLVTNTSGTVIKWTTPAHVAAKVAVSVTTSTFSTGTKVTAFTFVTPIAVTTTLTVTPSGHAFAGATVTLTAHISPVTAGTVQYLNSTVTFHSVAASGATTIYTTSVLPVATYHFKAKFIPSSTLYAGSTSSPAITYTITPAPAVTDHVQQQFAQTVTAGTLTLSCTSYEPTETAAFKTCPLISFTKVTLNGVTQTRTKPMKAIYIFTARGTSTSGWALSAAMVPTVTTLNTNASCHTAADFCNSSDGVHALNSHGQIPAADLNLSAGYTCAAAPTNSNPSPASHTHGVFGGTLALCTAAAGTSGGEFKVTGSTYTLTIPSTVYHGLYYGTVQYTLVST